MSFPMQLLDKEWRMKYLYTIRNKDGKAIPFVRNRAQTHYAKHAHTRNVILKSRQLGITTDACMNLMDLTLFVPNSYNLLIAQDQNKAKELFDQKIDFAWQSLDPSIKKLWKVDASSAQKLKFIFDPDNKNAAHASSTIMTAMTARGGTFNYVHVSEFAYICANYPDKARDLLDSVIPAVPDTGRVDIESTAEEAVGEFYDIFWDAYKRGEPKNNRQFKAHFYNWQWDDYELNKIKKVIEIPKDLCEEFYAYQAAHNLTDLELSWYYMMWESAPSADRWHFMKRNYPTTPLEAFESAGEKYFDTQKTKLLERYVTTPEVVGGWEYHERPRPNRTYVIGVDVSEGIGRDASTAVILDVTKVPKIVATYVDNEIAPDMLAYEIKHVAEKYNDALVGIERNNHGRTTLDTIKSEYRNLYKEKKTISMRDETTDRLGWHTNKSTRPRMFSTLQTLIADDELVCMSERFRMECALYTKKDFEKSQTSESSVTRHYDLLTAGAIALQLRDSVQYGGKAYTVVGASDTAPVHMPMQAHTQVGTRSSHVPSSGAKSQSII